MKCNDEQNIVIKFVKVNLVLLQYINIINADDNDAHCVNIE